MYSSSSFRVAIRKLQIQNTERIGSMDYRSKREKEQNLKKKMKNCENWTNKKETQKHTRNEDRSMELNLPIVGGYLAIKLHNDKNQNRYEKSPWNGDSTFLRGSVSILIMMYLLQSV